MAPKVPNKPRIHVYNSTSELCGAQMFFSAPPRQRRVVFKKDREVGLRELPQHDGQDIKNLALESVRLVKPSS